VLRASLGILKERGGMGLFCLDSRVFDFGVGLVVSCGLWHSSFFRVELLFGRSTVKAMCKDGDESLIGHGTV
jgi:hypothetical protein